MEIDRATLTHTRNTQAVQRQVYKPSPKLERGELSALEAPNTSV